MASKNIIAKGATYNGVESVTFPTSPSGTATFFEVSDTTATASDVLNSKYFYTAAGVKTQGTGTAPSPTLITKNITQNGTYDAEDDDADGYSSVTVSVSGGGGSGLVYETGTWTPTENIYNPTISFANSHSEPPVIIRLTDSDSPFSPSVNAVVSWDYYDVWKVTGGGFPTSSASTNYAIIQHAYLSGTAFTGGRNTTSHNSSEIGSTNAYPSYYATPSSFVPYASTSRFYIGGRTYKWIAVWAPTT